MNRITIEPNFGKGATVPNIGDTVAWQYEASNGMAKGNKGIVKHRHFWPSGDVTLTVKRT